MDGPLNSQMKFSLTRYSNLPQKCHHNTYLRGDFEQISQGDLGKFRKRENGQIYRNEHLLFSLTFQFTDDSETGFPIY